MENEIVYIEAWTLIDFALQLENAIHNGYKVSDKNEYAPMQIGHCYAATLVQVDKRFYETIENVTSDEKIISESVDNQTQQPVESNTTAETTKPRAGRKSKAV